MKVPIDKQVSVVLISIPFVHTLVLFTIEVSLSRRPFFFKGGSGMSPPLMVFVDEEMRGAFPFRAYSAFQYAPIKFAKHSLMDFFLVVDLPRL